MPTTEALNLRKEKNRIQQEEANLKKELSLTKSALDISTNITNIEGQLLIKGLDRESALNDLGLTKELGNLNLESINLSQQRNDLNTDSQRAGLERRSQLLDINTASDIEDVKIRNELLTENYVEGLAKLDDRLSKIKIEGGRLDNESRRTRSLYRVAQKAFSNIANSLNRQRELSIEKNSIAVDTSYLNSGSLQESIRQTSLKRDLNINKNFRKRAGANRLGGAGLLQEGQDTEGIAIQTEGDINSLAISVQKQTFQRQALFNQLAFELNNIDTRKRQNVLDRQKYGINTRAKLRDIKLKKKSLKIDKESIGRIAKSYTNIFSLNQKRNQVAIDKITDVSRVESNFLKTSANIVESLSLLSKQGSDLKRRESNLRTNADVRSKELRLRKNDAITNIFQKELKIEKDSLKKVLRELRSS